MNVDPITAPTQAPQNFQYMTIVRHGGLTGQAQTLRIEGADLRAMILNWDASAHDVDVDAAAAEDVLHALSWRMDGELAPAMTDGPPAAKPDVYQYDIELAYDGVVRRFHSNGLATDEAIKGAIDLADSAFGHHVESRSVPTDPRKPVGVEGRVAQNGNGGTVPPWLVEPGTPQA